MRYCAHENGTDGQLENGEVAYMYIKFRFVVTNMLSAITLLTSLITTTKRTNEVAWSVKTLKVQ